MLSSVTMGSSPAYRERLSATRLPGNLTRLLCATLPIARTVRAASATAQEEASGAGLVQFGMLVTATVMDLSKQADARAAIDNLAATARLRLRPVYGSQDSAFAAALPLGLVLPKHIKVPAELREKL